jgi:hypothetical protein
MLIALKASQIEAAAFYRAKDLLPSQDLDRTSEPVLSLAGFSSHTDTKER